MTFHTDTVAVPLEDIYIDETSPKITTPIPCTRYLLSERDFLEYSMGYSRGEMDALLETEKSFNTTVRQDVCESLFKHGWGIIQSEEQLTHIVDFFWSNFDCGVKNRVWYEQVRSEFRRCHVQRCSGIPHSTLLHLPPLLQRQTRRPVPPRRRALHIGTDSGDYDSASIAGHSPCFGLCGV
ncbi:hypothetical protein BDZ89DRAFT_1059380 [Hymenopellis radicata]|nr:hypothetical protein BDZ89DRAFT_1059380 [Hymenopellis radicata]